MYIILLIGIIFIVLNFIVSLKEYIISPERIFLITWGLTSILYAVSLNRYLRFNSQYILLIVMGTITFLCGTVLARIFSNKENNNKKKNSLLLSIRKYKILFYINLIGAILICLKSIYIVRQASLGNNFLTDLRLATLYLGYGIGILKYFIPFSFSILFFSIIKFDSLKLIYKKYKIYIFISGLCAFSNAFFSTGRGFLFTIIIGIVNCLFFRYYKKNKIKYFNKVLGISAIVLFVIFISYGSIMAKGIAKDSSINEKIVSGIISLIDYTGGNLQSLDYFLSEGYEFHYGRITFRTLYAIANIFNNNIEPVNLVQEFPKYENMNNTYTIYRSYVEDFGIIYAILIQFLFGFIHRFVYERALNYDDSFIFINSFLIFALIMQIMQDQYFSLMSFWIQILFYKFVLFSLKNKKIKK